jgi:hypothetical protein
MANWTIRDTQSGVSATFSVIAGEVTVTRSRDTGIFYNLKQGSPRVVYGPLHPAGIETPPFFVSGQAQYAAMMSILTAGNRLQVTNDIGETYAVMVNGEVKAVLQDTPRSMTPQWFITPTFIGVD